MFPVIVLKFDIVVGHHLGLVVFEIGDSWWIHLSVHLSGYILVSLLLLKETSPDRFEIGQDGRTPPGLGCFQN